MFRKNWISFWLLALGLLGTLAGCGGEQSGLNTVPVTGTVTMDGQAVEGARVAFNPTAPDGKGAVGMTDAAGRFVLQTLLPDDGALPGSYKVTVFKIEAESATARDTRGEMTPEQLQAAGGGDLTRAGQVKIKDLLPEKYKSPATTDLTAEVTEGGENSFEFELKK